MKRNILVIAVALFTSFGSFAQTGSKKPKEVEFAKDTVIWNGAKTFILDQSKKPAYTVKDLKGKALFTLSVETYMHASFRNQSNPTGTKIYWSFVFASLGKQFDAQPVTYGLSVDADLAKFIMVSKLLSMTTKHFVSETNLNPEGINQAVSMYGNRNAEERKKLESK